MQAKVYFIGEGRVRVAETTALSSSGPSASGRGWTGPAAAAVAVDELDAADPYVRGVGIVRSAVGWGGDSLRSQRVVIVTPKEASEVSEVYVDGTLVLVRSDAGELVTVGRKAADDEALADALRLMGGEGGA